MKNLIYFGHPVSVYNTPQEDKLVNIIEEHFPDFTVENPNQKHHGEGYVRYKALEGKIGMDYFFEEVLPKMYAGVFLPFEDEMFGAGVYKEADFIKKDGKSIYEIDYEGNIKDLIIDPDRFLSIDKTRERVYGKK